MENTTIDNPEVVEDTTPAEIDPIEQMFSGDEPDETPEAPEADNEPEEEPEEPAADEADETPEEPEADNEPEEEPEEPAADEADETSETPEADSEPDKPSTPAYINVVYGDKTAQLNLDAAETLGAALGLSPQAFVQIFEDAAEYNGIKDVLDTLQDYADLSGTDFDTFCDNLADDLPKMETTRILGELRNKYKDSDPALLAQMAEQQTQQKIDALRSKRKESQPDKHPALDAAVARWRLVSQCFPNVKSTNDIPKEVFDDCNKGADPVQSMYAYTVREKDKEIANLKQQLRAAKKNASNKTKSVGSMSGSTHGKTHRDEIMALFKS